MAEIFREAGDGRLELVGDFDGVYATVTDPWQQSAGEDGPMAAYYAEARRNLVEMIGGRTGTGVEIGCGHGHVAALLTASTGLVWQGMDISPLAIERAREIYPAIDFAVGDIRKPVEKAGHDIVLLNQVLWYVLPEIDATVENCISLLKPGGLLVVAQAYLRGPQRFAADIANGFAGVSELFATRYAGRLRLVDSHYCDDVRLPHRDGVLIYQC